MKTRLIRIVLATLVALAPLSTARSEFIAWDGMIHYLRPDLEVAGTYLLDYPDTIYIGVVVANDGFAPAGTFEVCVEGSGFSSVYSVYGLAAGDTNLVWVGIPKKAVRWNPSWTIYVDCRFDVLESDETNNTKTVTY